MKKSICFKVFVFMFVFLNSMSVAYCEQPVLSLPFHGGVSYKCTQGVNNSYTHQYTTTKYDLDFDTPNNADDDVLASTDGTAYIFTTDIFGNHVNIDHGGGYFTVYAHLKSFAVQNGEYVVQGQVIGKEGTTGHSDGDHIHWGLHSGDPKVKVESSTSVLAKFIIARDLTSDSSFKQMKSDDFIGGLSDGHFYESNNYGIVLKFPDSSTVYLSSNGKLWPILNEQVYAMLGYRPCNCSTTPDWDYVAKFPNSKKSKYSIKDEVIPSENNSATGQMIAYRVVPKVGPVSCMSIAVDSTRIYLFEDGKFCHIANERVYGGLFD